MSEHHHHHHHVCASCGQPCINSREEREHWELYERHLCHNCILELDEMLGVEEE